MSIPLNSRCFACNLQRNVNLARTLGDEETATAFTKDLMAHFLTAPKEAGSPWLGPGITDLLVKHFGVDPDRYREEKQFSNQFVLERLSQIQAQAENAEDPVYAGLQLAVLGNYIDFSALQGEVDFGKLDDMLRSSGDMELDMAVFEQFKQDLAKGKKLLYLTDNAGEIGFDRLFAEQISKQYPQVQITFCVRGGPIHNDATREDAAAVQLPFPVIDNGNTVGGTVLRLLSQEAKQAMDAADVVIAKGMGNTETMYGCGYNVYYAFLVKCQRIVEFFEKPMMTPMFIRDPGKRQG